MAERVKITCEVFIEGNEGEDGESLAMKLDSGINGALSHFPNGDVVYAAVVNTEPVTDEEVRDYFEEA